MVCLDSNFLIDFLKNKDYAIKKMRSLKENGEDVSTTTINSFELLKGALDENYKNSFDAINKLLGNLRILPFDFESSKKAAEIFELLKEKGEIIDYLDLMIASIAIVNKEKLLTGNLKHFSRVPWLEIEN